MAKSQPHQAPHPHRQARDADGRHHAVRRLRRHGPALAWPAVQADAGGPAQRRAPVRYEPGSWRLIAPRRPPL